MIGVSYLRRLLSWAPSFDGRLVLLACVGLYLTVVALGRLAWGIDLWPSLGVPPGPSLFFDARNLTAAWECDRLGYDPLYENPCDPWGRPLFYLRPWLLFGWLGLDQSHTVWLGVGLVTAMFLSLTALVGRVPAGTGLILGLAACSPAVMLAVERANMDVALFSVLALSALLWQAAPTAARIGAPLLVLLAAAAKLYPVFALPAFVGTRSHVAVRVSVLCLLAFVTYVAIVRDDVAHIGESAIQGQHYSYGARILPAHVYHQVGADSWAGPAVVKQALALLPLACVVALVALRVRHHMKGVAETLDAPLVTLVAFHVGALVYLGTFGVANNFDYRLVFLLMTLPQLTAWSRTRTDGLGKLAASTLVAVVVLLWIGSLSQQLSLWDELASWMVAGLFGAMEAAILPSIGTFRR
jgi:hypothetical protein